VTTGPPSLQRRRLFLCVLALAISALTDARAAPTKGDIDRFLRTEMVRGGPPGMSVAVVRDGRVEYARGFGYADLQNRVKATPETVYRIASITKQFTAAMVMQLVREGKIKLDDPIRKTLTILPEVWDKITVRQLLNHTSGIRDYVGLPGFFALQSRNPTAPDGIWRLVEKEPLDFEPGTKWSYSSTGYCILGSLIEKVDGRPYAESLKVCILDPLGMTQTYFTSEETVVKGRAQGYSRQPNGSYKNAAYLNMDWPYSAGSMESTVRDLAKWDAALTNATILPKDLLREMWAPTALTRGGKADYGFGWELANVNGNEIVRHSGGINGFRSEIERAPGKGLTVIVLTNSEAANAVRIASRLLGFVDPQLRKAPEPAIEDKDPETTRTARRVFEGILADKLDRTELGPKLNERTTPSMVSSVAAQFKAAGKLRKFELLSASDNGEGKQRTYRAMVGTWEVRLDFVFGKSGLIEELLLHM
jgi:CubicO group peptidase (beta-lactamase class C family)